MLFKPENYLEYNFLARKLYLNNFYYKVLGSKFDMKDLGELMYFSGIEVIRTSQVYGYCKESRYATEIWYDGM